MKYHGLKPVASNSLYRGKVLAPWQTSPRLVADAGADDRLLYLANALNEVTIGPKAVAPQELFEVGELGLKGGTSRPSAA